MTPRDGGKNYLDPKVLQTVSRLELRARLVVEGFISGLHKSPYRGSSVEFAEHREYVPGDDVRHIDWKVFGRSDRIYIKRYEEETNLRAYLLVDASESMAYPLAPQDVVKGAGGEFSKYDYASSIAASLAYLSLRQQDAVGVALFDDHVGQYLPPSSNPSHIHAIVEVLESPTMRKRTDLGSIFHEFADRVTKKGLIVILSDMFDDLANIRDGLRHLRYKNHDVIVFHVLDHDELTFPFQRMTLFEGLEEAPQLMADPRALRNAYLEELQSHMEEVRRSCRDIHVDYVQVDTSEKLNVVLSAYLAARTGALRA